MERVLRHEAEIAANLVRALATFQHAAGHYHPLKLHPVLGRKPDITHEKRMQVTLAASERTAHVRNAVAFSQRETFQAIAHARVGLDNSPR